MSTVTFKDVVKKYGSTTAVDQVSLEIKAGEFCSLVGPSGCGKTTLLRIAAGFTTPDKGMVLLDGQPVTKLPPNKRNLGFVFQNYALFPTKTVRQNIGFSLSLRRRSRAEINNRVNELCALMDLGEMTERFPHELSGGQQQRVALARALASQPSILLLDEPLSALDAKIRAHLRGEIRRIVKTLGVTAVYVTHDQEEALSISDRVAVMNQGNLLQIAPPMEVYLQPADLFVAQFMGISNTIPCHVTAPDRIELSGHPLSMATPRDMNGPATLSVRPEHVILKEPDQEGIPCELQSISFLGQTVRLSVQTLDRPLMADVPAMHWLDRPRDMGALLKWTVRPGFSSLFPAIDSPC